MPGNIVNACSQLTLNPVNLQNSNGPAGFPVNRGGQIEGLQLLTRKQGKLMLNYIRSMCVLAVSALALPAQTAAVAATVKTTAMIGLAQGQTAQLNLLNPGAPAAGAICTAAVTYFDAGGAALKTSTVSVAPGTSSAVDLTDTELSIAVGARREIRAQFSIPAVLPPASTGNAPMIPASCTLIPTLEIFDSASGRTLVSLGGAHAVPSGIATPVN
jgi:hypothetical protein